MLKLLIKNKDTGEVVISGDYYVSLNGEVFEYSHSPVAGHFEDDPKQLRRRDELVAEIEK